MSSTWLIAGLGNPGQKYERTRHNAGFVFLDELVRETGATLRAQSRMHSESGRIVWQEQVCILCRPTTFMNESGQAVRALMDYYNVPPDNVLVAHDELDLPSGDVRLKRGGGHGGHNGLRSLFSHLGSPDFLRLRIGIGHPGVREAVTPWVLGRATAEDEDRMLEAARRAVKVLPDILAGRLGAAMKALHTR